MLGYVYMLFTISCAKLNIYVVLLKCPIISSWGFLKCTPDVALVFLSPVKHSLDINIQLYTITAYTVTIIKIMNYLT